MEEQSLRTIIYLLSKVFNVNFSDKQDSLIFAVLSYFYGKGYRLVAFGDNSDSSTSEIEVKSLEGWNSNKTIYQFKLIPENGSKDQAVLLKCLQMGDDKLLTSWVLEKGDQGVKSVELTVQKFVGEDGKTLKNLLSFLEIMEQQERRKQDRLGSASPAYNPMPQQPTNPLLIPTSSRHGDAFQVGRDDLNPFGGMERGDISGNLVGPNHPIFRRKYGDNNDGLQDKDWVHPEGAKIDLIGPPGMPGSHPRDYVHGPNRRRRDVDDIGRPPAGFPDHMFM